MSNKKKPDFDSINKLIGTFTKKQKREIQEELEREAAQRQVDYYETARQWAGYSYLTTRAIPTTATTITNGNDNYVWWTDYMRVARQLQPAAEDYEDVTDD